MRREALLGHGIPNKDGVIRSALPTERSRDMRTVAQIQQLVPWVSQTLLHPKSLTIFTLTG
jgi:hypothetical protein